MSLPGRILVATDFSDGAKEAAVAGIEFAARFGAQLYWVHASEVLPESMPPRAQPLIATYVEQARQAAEEKLRALCDLARERRVESQLAHVGLPAARGITEHAREIGADWIVVGTHGVTGLRHALLGSVAERTAREASCSVLAVRGTQDPVSPGVVLLGDDFSETSRQARSEALELARALSARLRVVHGLDPGIAYLSSMEVSVPTQLLTEAQTEVCHRLGEESKQAGIEVRNVVVSELPTTALCAQAEETRAGLMVLGTHGRTGIAHALLGSVAERTLRHAPCSVLLVRSGAAS